MQKTPEFGEDIKMNEGINPLRIAVIGCGNRGRGHMRIMHNFEDVDLVAVCDPVESARYPNDCAAQCNPRRKSRVAGLQILKWVLSDPSRSTPEAPPTRTPTHGFNMACRISNRARKLGLLGAIVLAGLYLAACLD